MTVPGPRELLRKAARALAYVAGIFVFAAVVNYFQAPATSRMAPVGNLDLLTLHGEKTQWNGASGKKTVVYFFAPWCAVCKASMDALDFFQGSDRVQAIAIGLDYDNVAELGAFREKVSVPMYAGTNLVQRQFQVDRYPTAYILNGDGSIAHVMVGYTSRFGIWIRTLL